MIQDDGSVGNQGPQNENSETQEIEQVTVLNEQLNEALREKEQFHAMAQRAQADLANYRRRAAEEVQEARQGAAYRILLKVISVIDDMQRAIALVPKDAVVSGWYEGLELVLKKLDQVLESEGVSKIEALGRPFEPWELEGVAYEETTEVAEGIVTKVTREGYKYRDKVLRAAQVVVAKKPAGDINKQANEEAN